MGILADYFEHILENPVIHISDASVTRVFIYLLGIKQGYHAATQEWIEDDVMDGFQKYIERRYETGIFHHWSGVLLFFEGGSEYRAFERAKQLWKEYKAELDEKVLK